MTDTPSVVVTSLFRRTVQPAEYETVVAECSISQTFTGEIDPESIAMAAQDQFIAVKSQVFLELGRPFEQDEVSGRIIEIFPGTEVVESRKATPPRKAVARLAEPTPDERADAEYEEYAEEQEAPPARTAPRAPRAPRPVAPAAKPATRAPRPAALRAAPSDDDPDGLWQSVMDEPDRWYFNEPETKPNPRGPDFSHKTAKKPGTNFKVALWLSNAPDWFVNPFTGE